MSSPTTRVLALLEMLQSHGLITGAELAQRLEVHPRTLRRYIQALEALGIPVLAERGRDGGYRLMQGRTLPPMMFSNDEALALALGLLASRRLGLAGTAPASAGALAKLERVLPERLRRRMRAIDETVQLDLRRLCANGDAEHLALLSVAAQQRQRVHLHYCAADQQNSERVFDPYGLALLGGHWYALGYCHLREDIRSFRLDRVRATTLLPASFARPDSFDPLAHLTASLQTVPRAHAARVNLHADLATASTALFSALGVLEASGKHTILHVQVDDLDWLARELARLPFAFTVNSPPTLTRALRRHVQRLSRAAGQPN